jgi:hypothetical protein
MESTSNIIVFAKTRIALLFLRDLLCVPYASMD